MKKVVFLVLMIGMMGAKGATAQNDKNGDFICCIDSVLRNIRSGWFTFDKIGDGRFQYGDTIVTLSNYFSLMAKDINFTINDNTLTNWFKMIRKDSIKVYGIFNDQNRYYLLSSEINAPTGLAVNFTIWIVIDLHSKKTTEFWSLSDKPDFFSMYNKDSKKLTVLIFDFSEDYLYNRDINNTSFNIETYELLDGTKSLIKKTFSKCKCN